MVTKDMLSSLARRTTGTEMESYCAHLPTGTIAFTSGQPSPDILPLGLLSPILTQLVETEPELFGYGAGQGDVMLVQELANRSVSLGFSDPVPTDRVLITNGALGGAHLVASAMIDQSDVVLAEDPTYPETTDAFAKFGARVIGVSCDSQGLLPDELDRLAATLHPKVLYVIPHFQNPRGSTTSVERRRAIAEAARRHGFLVFEDDPYRDLSFTDRPLPSICSMAPERTVFAGSFSKTVAPGLRCGWLISPPDLAERLLTIHVQTSMSLPIFIHRAIALLIRSPGFTVHLDNLRNDLSTRCRLLTDALTVLPPGRVEFIAPKGGMFLWCRLPGRDGIDVRHKLLGRYGLAAMPGELFSPSRSFRDCLRLTFSRQPMDLLRQGAERLALALTRV